MNGTTEKWLERAVLGLALGGVMWWLQNITTITLQLIADAATLKAQIAKWPR